tara:strand:- start:1388 stop:2242 length:855 start_codon:yes stop_codon:yes gene_type:complete
MAKDLTTDQELDTHLKPIKSGEVTTSLELASQDNGARVRGNLEVSGKITTTGGHLETPNLKIDDPDSQIKADGNFTFDATGNVVLQSNQATGSVQFKSENYTGVQMTMAEGSTANIFQVNKGNTSTAALSIITDANDATITSGEQLNIETGTNNFVEFDGCGVGFDLVACTYNATATLVDFRQGNKQKITFGSGNITNVIVQFPATSGNFTLLLKQDGSGSRTITNYNAYDEGGSAASGSATVKFAGGSNPTLTTDANHVDIISFFWDADDEIAYGVATLDFQF